MIIFLLVTLLAVDCILPVLSQCHESMLYIEEVHTCYYPTPPSSGFGTHDHAALMCTLAYGGRLAVLSTPNLRATISTYLYDTEEESHWYWVAESSLSPNPTLPIVTPPTCVIFHTNSSLIEADCEWRLPALCQKGAVGSPSPSTPQSEPSTEGNNQDGDASLGIILGVVTFLVILAAVICVLLLYRRRKQYKRAGGDTRRNSAESGVYAEIDDTLVTTRCQVEDIYLHQHLAPPNPYIHGPDVSHDVINTPHGVYDVTNGDVFHSAGYDVMNSDCAHAYDDDITYASKDVADQNSVTDPADDVTNENTYLEPRRALLEHKTS